MSRLIEILLQASMFGLAKSPFHLTRHSMYQQLSKTAPNFGEKVRVLSVSGSEGLIDVLKVSAESIVSANYPDVSILELPYSDASFDLVISDQVLEHVSGDPYLAVSESVRVLRPGGFFVHTSCFMNPIHMYPGDYWRFTEDALRNLANQFGEVVSSGAWGNFCALWLMKENLRFTSVPLNSWHPINRIATHNDPDWPIVTWVIGQKSGAPRP
jgi:SAM-dependent methyltransferase